MTNPIVQINPSARELAAELTKIVKRAISELGERERITVALSGGNTPARIFSYISLEFQNALDWSKVHFFWGDERCVAPNSDQSNYKMALVSLLKPLNIPRENIFRIMGEYEPEQALLHYRQLMLHKMDWVHRLPHFDLVLLGLGDDGHTASIFPGDTSSLQSKEPCVLTTHPTSKQQRVSIPMPVINNASHVVFLVTGVSKAEIVKNILGPHFHSEYPAAHVKPKHGKLSWLLDEDAASLL